MNLNEVADRFGTTATEIEVIAARLEHVYGKLTGDYKPAPGPVEVMKGDTIYHKFVVIQDFQREQVRRLFQVLNELESLVAEYVPPKKSAVLGTPDSL